jgi:hypothetical protein
MVKKHRLAVRITSASMEALSSHRKNSLLHTDSASDDDHGGELSDCD